MSEFGSNLGAILTCAILIGDPDEGSAGAGVPRTITDAQVEEVVVRTLEETPEGATHWSKRDLAR